MTTLKKTVGTTLGLLGVLFAVGVTSLFLGTVEFPPEEILQAIGRRFLSPSKVLEEPAEVVLFALRLPRVLQAALAGSGLAVAGAAFQALTRNPLADPFVLGVSSGAAFGVVAAQVLGLAKSLPGYIGSSLFGFLGALLAAAVVYQVAKVNGKLPVQTLLLSGVIVSLFFSSGITLLIALLSPAELPGIFHWLMGDLGPIGFGPLLFFLLALLLGIGSVYGQAKSLNLFTLGEEAAMQLGVESERMKRAIFLEASFLTGVVVAFCGSIAFVGLIVPHMARMLFGPDHRVLIPTAALSGASFLVAADTLARTIASPAEIPVGVITSFCGAPFFIYLLRRRYRSAL